MEGIVKRVEKRIIYFVIWVLDLLFWIKQNIFLNKLIGKFSDVCSWKERWLYQWVCTSNFIHAEDLHTVIACSSARRRLTLVATVFHVSKVERTLFFPTTTRPFDKCFFLLSFPPNSKVFIAIVSLLLHREKKIRKCIWSPITVNRLFLLLNNNRADKMFISKYWFQQCLQVCSLWTANTIKTTSSCFSPLLHGFRVPVTHCGINIRARIYIAYYRLLALELLQNKKVIIYSKWESHECICVYFYSDFSE